MLLLDWAVAAQLTYTGLGLGFLSRIPTLGLGYSLP